jgi:hypothetical protein
MTDRNFEKELCYSRYGDLSTGSDVEYIDYKVLFSIINELHTRIEKLEQQVNDEICANCGGYCK